MPMLQLFTQQSLKMFWNRCLPGSRLQQKHPVLSHLMTNPDKQHIDLPCDSTY